MPNNLYLTAQASSVLMMSAGVCTQPWFAGKMEPGCSLTFKLPGRQVLAVQPYINLATVINNSSLEAQVGGASNLAQFHSMKQQLDPQNLFSRHSFVGL